MVTIDPAIEHLKQYIANGLLEMYPSCNTVVRDLGISGQYRIPQRELLVGNNTETINKENGCLFKLDVSKVMFSKGNLHEKKLMSSIGSNETIVDMFAGIGYFTIPMAVHAKPAKIIAIEINPESYGFLNENIALNHVENMVEALNGDCGEITPTGIADRVLMGYVNTTHHYLKQGIEAIRKEGGILHYHETTPEKLIFTRPIRRIEQAALKAGRKVEITDCRKIKKYSPGVWHVVVDARII
ncbi:MAG: class I SAM-dependent methyltransferase family protein [Methanolobus sp.]